MKWSDLRAFGRVTLLRFAFGPALVGFVLAALLEESSGSKLEEIAQALAGDPAAVLFFIGCLGLSAGLLIYDTRCPSHIRRFETDYEFYNAQKEALESFKTAFELRQALQRDLDPYKHLVSGGAVQETHTQETYLYGEYTRVFTSRWSDVDKKRLLERIACAIFFYVSALLVFVALLVGSAELALRAWL